MDIYTSFGILSQGFTWNIALKWTGCPGNNNRRSQNIN